MFLFFLYTDSVLPLKESPTHIPSLFLLADLYQVDTLKEQCFALFDQALCLSSCIDLLLACDGCMRDYVSSSSTTDEDEGYDEEENSVFSSEDFDVNDFNSPLSLLREMALRFIAEHFDDVSKHAGFSKLNRSTILDIVQRR